MFPGIQPVFRPPSTVMSAPVTQEASGDSKNSTTSATSSGWPGRAPNIPGDLLAQIIRNVPEDHSRSDPYLRLTKQALARYHSWWFHRQPTE
jgi:hypothetical protein